MAAILFAFAAFSVIVVRLGRPLCATDHAHDDAELRVQRAQSLAGRQHHRHHETGAGNAARRIDLEQLRGFVYVGAGALALLAIAVIAMGLFANRSGRAEGLAVLGLFGYAAYLVAATVVLYVMSRKS